MKDNKNQMLAAMISLAARGHENQFDKSGQPYILHTLKVMHYLKTDDVELKCIAVGHDLVEDCKHLLINHFDLNSFKKFNIFYLWKIYLKKFGFTDRIICGIFCLTKIPQMGETYDEYKLKVKSNPDAVLVKMADLRHNSDIRRLKGITEKDIERTRKYHEFYLELVQLTNGVKND